MKQNFFKTLGDALQAVRDYLVESKCVLADESDLFNTFCFGGVSYGQTLSRSSLLSIFKGKEITGRKAQRACTLTIYRMESGTYEAVCYVA